MKPLNSGTDGQAVGGDTECRSTLTTPTTSVHSRPPIVDWVEWLLVGIFDLAGAAACTYIVYLLLMRLI